VSLPKFQTPVQQINQLQTTWTAQLDPLLANPLSSGILLSDISLINGSTTFSHKLGRVPQGWFLVAPLASAIVYQAATQSLPALQLTLISNSAVKTSIYVF
jgi:hypothetical protein